MEPISFDLLETVVFPIVGGVIAGIFVILVALGFRVFVYQRHQRRNAEKALSELFGEWEKTINDATALVIHQLGQSYTSRPTALK